MIRSIKIRLKPTKEQENLMFRTIGASRFAYNWGLARWNELRYKNVKFNINDIRKDFRLLKKEKQYLWLNDIPSHTLDESLRTLNIAFQRFFKYGKGYPKFKTKRKSKQAFYVRMDTLYFKQNKCHFEKIGNIKFVTNYKIPKCKYYNPHCCFDGKYWYLGFGVEIEETQTILNQNLSIGIDLGIKHLAVLSNCDTPIENINYSHEIIRLKKKLKRKQRQVSRKYLMNKNGNKYIKTKNIIKLEREIKLIFRRMINIRINHIHQATSYIVKQCPKRIVLEDLDIIDLMKNRPFSDKISDQKLYEFIRQIEYKSELYGIEVIKADKYYPSSKKCSNCGHVKRYLSLKDRTYICEECGFVIDRDKNASINLANYKLN